MDPLRKLSSSHLNRRFNPDKAVLFGPFFAAQRSLFVHTKIKRGHAFGSLRVSQGKKNRQRQNLAITIMIMIMIIISFLSFPAFPFSPSNHTHNTPPPKKIVGTTATPHFPPSSIFFKIITDVLVTLTAVCFIGSPRPRLLLNFQEKIPN